MGTKWVGSTLAAPLINLSTTKRTTRIKPGPLGLCFNFWRWPFSLWKRGFFFSVRNYIAGRFKVLERLFPPWEGRTELPHPPQVVKAAGTAAAAAAASRICKTWVEVLIKGEGLPTRKTAAGQIQFVRSSCYFSIITTCNLEWWSEACIVISMIDYYYANI